MLQTVQPSPNPEPWSLPLRAHPTEPRSSGPRRAHLLALGIPAVELLRLRLPLHHGVHSFQVGGVGHERQSDVPVRDSIDPLVVHAEVIFDISRTLKVEVACDEVPTIPDMQVHSGAGTSPGSAPWESRAVSDSSLHSSPNAGTRPPCPPAGLRKAGGFPGS